MVLIICSKHLTGMNSFTLHKRVMKIATLLPDEECKARESLGLVHGHRVTEISEHAYKTRRTEEQGKLNALIASFSHKKNP